MSTGFGYSLAWLAFSGFAGAISRYALTVIIHKVKPSAMPLGTLAVNVLGSFLLGRLWGQPGGELFTLAAGTGFLGAFTTFSAFKLETLQLTEQGLKRTAILYTVLSYAGGLLAAAAGYFSGVTT